MSVKGVFGMLLMMTAAAVIGSATGWAQPAGQLPPPGCKQWNADLPAAWEAWAQAGTAVTAASAPAAAAKAAVEVGKKASVTLTPAKAVHMAVETPDVDPPKNAHKGILSLHVPADGYYWIASSEGLWVDVLAGGMIVESSDHGPGPHCASVRKAVQFLLKAGDVSIQLSDNSGPKVDILVTRVP